MSDRSAKRVVAAPALLMALLATLWPSVGSPALPPAAEEVSAQKGESEAAERTAAPAGGASADRENRPTTTWAMPPVRMGGTLAYSMRRDITEEQTSTQNGLTATLTATTDTFIWQPWFAQLGGRLGMTMSRDSSDRNEMDSSNRVSGKSVIMTGNGQLSILRQSPYPFEAHFDKNDSRVSNELAIADTYASQRYGFTQHYLRAEGDSMIGGDRNTQTSDRTGRDRQDTLQLSLSHALEFQHVQLTGNHSRNTHESTGENAVQNNLFVQHSYTPGPAISVETMANISRSGYHLEQGDNSTHLVQLSSLAFWRPADKPMTVTGGARLLALAVESSGVAINDKSVGARVRNGNVNFGVNYDASKTVRINGGANVNLVENNGDRSSNTNQSVGVTYQPESIEVSDFHYSRTASSVVTNTTGAHDAGRQLTLQLSHNLSRRFALGTGSAIGTEIAQSVAALTGSAMSNGESASTKRLTHSGSVSWDMSKETGMALLRLSATDSRNVGGNEEFFQMINFQASSNLPTGNYGSWSGNLTIQAVRQNVGNVVGMSDTGLTQQRANQKQGFVTTSTGSLIYQQQRAFGVRRLRFMSSLRLNSQALLPLLGDPMGQETAGWENRLDYSIGRTQIRFNALISRSSAQKTSFDPATGTDSVTGETRVNKSIMLTVTRAFGDF